MWCGVGRGEDSRGLKCSGGAVVKMLSIALYRIE